MTLCLYEGTSNRTVFIECVKTVLSTVSVFTKELLRRPNIEVRNKNRDSLERQEKKFMIGAGREER